MKKISSVLVLSLLIGGSVSPVQEKTPFWVSAGVTAAGLAGVKALTQMEDFHGDKICESEGALVLSAVVLGAGGLLYWILSESTPKGRLKRAMDMVNSAEFNSVIQAEYAGSDELIDFINSIHISSHWPLVKGKNALAGYANSLKEAQRLLNAADIDLFTDDSKAHIHAKNIELHKLIGIELQRVSALQSIVFRLVDQLVKHPDYKAQLSFYTKYQEIEAMKELRREVVGAQRIHYYYH